jgi:hypothetical protein
MTQAPLLPFVAVSKPMIRYFSCPHKLTSFAFRNSTNSDPDNHELQENVHKEVLAIQKSTPTMPGTGYPTTAEPANKRSNNISSNKGLLPSLVTVPTLPVVVEVSCPKMHLPVEPKHHAESVSALHTESATDEQGDTEPTPVKSINNSLKEFGDTANLTRLAVSNNHIPPIY